MTSGRMYTLRCLLTVFNLAFARIQESHSFMDEDIDDVICADLRILLSLNIKVEELEKLANEELQTGSVFEYLELLLAKARKDET